MENTDKLIWTSQPNFEDYRDDMRADFPECSDLELQEILTASNWDKLQFDREELAHRYNDSILVIADLGLWDGRHPGYKEIDSCNLMDCFETSRDTLDIEWFVDKNGDLRCNDYHHDGTNHYLYRVWKDNISEAQKDNLVSNFTGANSAVRILPIAQNAWEMKSGRFTAGPSLKEKLKGVMKDD